jgi:hypothetical protein
MGKDDDEEVQQNDGRMDWISERVCSTLKVKPDKFADMDEVALFAMKDFMDKADIDLMYIFLGAMAVYPNLITPLPLVSRGHLLMHLEHIHSEALSTRVIPSFDQVSAT